MSYTKVEGGYLHTGLGYRRDREGNYPIYPLPRWGIYDGYYRHNLGSNSDIMHYMIFFINNYQTRYNCDITGDEIADTMANLYGTSAAGELAKMNLPHKSWSEVFESLIRHSDDEADRQLNELTF